MQSVSRLKTLGLSLFCLLFISHTYSEVAVQPNYDIVLFDLIEEEGSYLVRNAQLIANSLDYENQPAFSNDSNKIYFTRIEKNNADMWQWSLSDNRATKLIDDELSEYSPTPIPFNPENISTVRVEKDGVQRLWQYSPQNGFSLLFNSIQPVGYHVWSGSHVGLFVLGEPHQLQVAQLGNEKTKIVDSNIGRCLQKVPEKNAMSYTVIENELHRLKVYDFSSGLMKKLMLLPAKTQDYVWLSPDQIIFSDGKALFISRSGSDKKTDWLKINNSTKFELTEISRLAISPDKSKLAVVFVAH